MLVLSHIRATPNAALLGCAWSSEHILAGQNLSAFVTT